MKTVIQEFWCYGTLFYFVLLFLRFFSKKPDKTPIYGTFIVHQNRMGGPNKTPASIASKNNAVNDKITPCVKSVRIWTLRLRNNFTKAYFTCKIFANRMKPNLVPSVTEMFKLTTKWMIYAGIGVSRIKVIP